MIEKVVTEWLLKGDISIKYQTFRDLLDNDQKDLKDRIITEGWGAKFLSYQNNDGHWGIDFYRPKWTCTHYTLLILKELQISENIPQIDLAINNIIKKNKERDGGINPVGTVKKSDVCINGMFLNYSCYFGINENDLKSVIDFVLKEQLTDGGFNCHSNRKGARHSSLHTTISVLEGINEYLKKGYLYRAGELKKVKEESVEFILKHRLFKSDHTGKVIDKKFTMLSFPSRWRYDILRALDFFRAADISYDPRMDDAIDLIIRKRRKDLFWPVQQKHPGEIHFEMEKTGDPSRWNTLRVLRVLKHFNIEI